MDLLKPILLLRLCVEGFCGFFLDSGQIFTSKTKQITLVITLKWLIKATIFLI